MVKTDVIAVFDSGVGGVSVLRHLVRAMPEERYIYFGDSANAPYGTRTHEEVRRLTFHAVEELYARYQVKALVIACNTATAAAVSDLRARYPGRIIVGIEPALKVAADHFPGGRVGVMATQVTLGEERFGTLVHRFDGRCAVERIPAPGLVEAIERGEADSPQTEALLRKVLTPYVGRLDALVLGCTHYPFAARAITRVLGPQVTLLDGGAGTARETRRRLEEAGLRAQGPGGVTFTNSLGTPEILAQCRRLLESPE